MDRTWNNCRNDFPLLQEKVNDEPLVYLDNAATTQKPRSVIQASTDFYEHFNANIYRGVHTLSQRATAAYEAVRREAAEFIGAKSSAEIVFTKGTTDSLNMVAFGWALHRLGPGDEIAVSPAEHHSNLVPWQQVAKLTGAHLVYLPLADDGQLDLGLARVLIDDRTKLVALAQVTNVLGTIVPIKEVAKIAHQHGAKIVVDGAQAAGHLPVDVQDLDADFYAFSGHKMLAQTGVGVLYGKYDLLEQLTPFEFGGEMIDSVGLDEATFKEPPLKFEAGTQNISGVLSLGAAINYLLAIGQEEIARREQEFTQDLLKQLTGLSGVTVYGPKIGTPRGPIVSFNLDGVHPHDLATALDLQGIAIRAGHHCAQPLLAWLGCSATARASLALYNNEEDLAALVKGVENAKEFFAHGLGKIE